MQRVAVVPGEAFSEYGEGMLGFLMLVPWKPWKLEWIDWKGL